MKKSNKFKFWVIEYQCKSLEHYNALDYFFKDKSYTDSWIIDKFSGKYLKKESAIKSFKHKLKVSESYRKSDINVYQDIFYKNWRIRNISTDEITNLS